MAALSKYLQKDRPSNASEVRVEAANGSSIRAEVSGYYLKILQAERNNALGGWVSKTRLETLVGHGSLGSHTLFYPLQDLIRRNLVERKLAEGRAWFRVTHAGNQGAALKMKNVREREMDLILSFFNAQVNRNRTDITRLEVARYCKRTDVSARIFSASFNKLLERGLIVAVPSATGRRSGRFRRGP